MQVPLSTTKSTRLPTDVVLSLLTIYIVWGSTYLAIRYALISIPPFVLMGSRFTLAGVMLFTFLQIRRTSLPTPQQWLHAAIAGTLLLVTGSGMTAFAEQYVTSSFTAIALSASPIFFALFMGLTGKWPNGLEWAGIAIGCAGVLLLNIGTGTIGAAPIGVIALLVGSISWSLGSVLTNRKLSLPPGLMGSASEMLTGGPLLMLAGLLRGEHLKTPVAPEAAAAFVYLVLVGSLVAYSAYVHLIRRVSPTLASTYAYVNPVVAVVLGVVIAHEPVSSITLVAMLVILGGVVLITLGRTKS